MRAASSSFSDADAFSSSRESQIAALVSSRSDNISGHRTSGPYFLSSRSAHSGSAGSVRSTPGGTNVMSFSAPQSGWRPSSVAYGFGAASAKPSPAALGLVNRTKTSFRASISTSALSKPALSQPLVITLLEGLLLPQAR